MQAFKRFLLWVFALSAVSAFQVAVGLGIHGFHSSVELSFWRLYLVPGAFLVTAVVFALAWWTVWRKKPSGRVWGSIASLLNIATAILPFVWDGRDSIRYVQDIGFLSVFGLIFLLGVGGLVVFLRPDAVGTSESSPVEHARITGDCTITFLNKIASVLFTIAYLAGWQWWALWARAREIHTSSYFILSIFACGFLVTFVHELGHTLTGLALGMKLRFFQAGPFQWRLYEGRWEFKFNLMGILADSGGTGLIRTTPGQPLANFLLVVLAGPLVNLAVGLLAFISALHADAESPLQFYGLTSMFGVLSLISFALNLIPIKLGQQYSDGARILQLLSKGTWAKLYRILEDISASTQTPYRPRDFDIESITTVSESIREGLHSVLLRIFAHDYFLDRGNIDEARRWFSEAVNIQRTAQVLIPTELHTVFVFGAAYAMRDAKSARDWWDAMVAKKPTRFNVDYWRAKCALHWIEGNALEAQFALQKSLEQAALLPVAGIYDFDRYCCDLMRKELAKSPALP